MCYAVRSTSSYKCVNATYVCFFGATCLYLLFVVEHFTPLYANTPWQGSRVGQAAATPTAAFVPLVIRCASNPHLLARVASARALAALVPPAEAPDVITELLSRLPKHEVDATIAMPAGASAYNHMHGEKWVNGTHQRRVCYK